MARRILLLAAGLAAACGGVIREAPATSRQGALSFAQYQSLERDTTAKAIVNAFGPPVDVLRREDRVRGLKYWCEGANGEAVELRLIFSAEERLEKWSLRKAKTPAPKAG